MEMYRYETHLHTLSVRRCGAADQLKVLALNNEPK